jgi:hypothetical protein
MANLLLLVYGYFLSQNPSILSVKGRKNDLKAIVCGMILFGKKTRFDPDGGFRSSYPIHRGHPGSPVTLQSSQFQYHRPLQ